MKRVVGVLQVLRRAWIETTECDLIVPVGSVNRADVGADLIN